MFRQNSTVYRIADIVRVAHHLQNIVRHQLLCVVVGAGWKIERTVAAGHGIVYRQRQAVLHNEISSHNKASKICHVAHN